MRIAILSNEYPPTAQGGAGRIAQLQAEWLVQKGHEVKVWTVAPVEINPEPVPVQPFTSRTSIGFRSLSKKGPFARLLFHLEDVAPNLDAVDKIRAWNPDVLVSHNLTGCGWGTPHLLKSGNVRWIHILHDVQMFEPSGQRLYGESLYAWRRLWRRWWANYRQRSFGSPDAIISPTRWLLEQHKSHGLFNNISTFVVPNPMSDSLKIGNVKKSTERVELNKSKQILFVGRLSHDKGLGILLDAWRSLKQKPGHLVLVGDGPMLATCKQLSDESVDCLGRLDHDQVMACMTNVDLVVLPSLVMENQPTVLLEAMSLGIPVVATDVGGVRETLAGYGTIVKPGDARALAEGILSSLVHITQSQLSARILEKHDQDTVMGELVEIISDHK